MPLIRDVARVCKSKNAGPFELTIDVVFDDAETFGRVKATGVLGPPLSRITPAPFSVLIPA